MKNPATNRFADPAHFSRRSGARTAALALAFCLVHAPAAFAADARVGIDNFSFNPQELTVKPGTTVVFENNDDIPHLVADSGGAFRSKALDTGDKFSITFDKPGEVAYFCGLHPHMKGKIIVAP